MNNKPLKKSYYGKLTEDFSENNIKINDNSKTTQTEYEELRSFVNELYNIQNKKNKV